MRKPFGISVTVRFRGGPGLGPVGERNRCDNYDSSANFIKYSNSKKNSTTIGVIESIEGFKLPLKGFPKINFN